MDNRELKPQKKNSFIIREIELLLESNNIDYQLIYKEDKLQSIMFKKEDKELDLIKSIMTLKKELKKEDSTIYNLWIDSIHHNVFDKFRRYRGDKSAFGLYEKEITLSYKEINDICFEGAKDFIDKISVLNINYK